MKNKSVILLLILAVLVFSSCADGSTTTNSSSVPEATADSLNIVSSESNGEDLCANITEDEPICCEPLPLDGKNSFVTIKTENYEYSFNGEFCSGRYDTEFTGVKNDSGGITLTLRDGRTMYLNYSEVTYDEKDEIYRTEINGLDFMITEGYTTGNEFVQNFECIEMPEIFKNTDIITTILITYYPELGHGQIAISYVYEVDGEKVTLHYADGGVLTKTIKWDENKGEYYIGE